MDPGAMVSTHKKTNTQAADFFVCNKGSSKLLQPCSFVNILIDSKNATLTLDRYIYSVYVSIKFEFSENILRSSTPGPLLSSFIGDFKQLQIIDGVL